MKFRHRLIFSIAVACVAVAVFTSCEEAVPAPDYSVRGTVASGDYLALVHGLERDDLTFAAQFIKDSIIYNHSEYVNQFGTPYWQGSGPVVFESAGVDYVSAITLDNGNVFIAYQDLGNTGYGTFVICSPDGTIVEGPTVFDQTSAVFIETDILPNGNVIITYGDDNNAVAGTFVICNPAGQLVTSPTVYDGSSMQSIETAVLLDGNILSVYPDLANTNAGTLIIYDQSGSVVTGPTVFDPSPSFVMSAAMLSNGDVLLAYRTNAQIGFITTMDSSGSVVDGPTVFTLTASDFISAAALPNGSTFVAYREGPATVRFVIYGSGNVLVNGGTLFEVDNAGELTTATLSDGRVLVRSGGLFVVLDSAGMMISGHMVLGNQLFPSMSAAGLQNGDVMIAYSDNDNANYGTLVTYLKAGLRLEKVSPNEVRLHNRTEETLELMLSVVQ